MRRFRHKTLLLVTGAALILSGVWAFAAMSRRTVGVPERWAAPLNMGLSRWRASGITSYQVRIVEWNSYGLGGEEGNGRAEYTLEIRDGNVISSSCSSTYHKQDKCASFQADNYTIAGLFALAQQEAKQSIFLDITFDGIFGFPQRIAHPIHDAWWEMKVESFQSTQAGSLIATATVIQEFLPLQPSIAGDIPNLVTTLRQAYESRNSAICSNFPTPQPQQIFLDDNPIPAPGKEAWERYCLALTTLDPEQCQKITAATQPNLQKECLTVLGTIVRKQNNSYTNCYEYAGTLYPDSYAVRECIRQYDLESAPVFYRDLVMCLDKSTEPINHIGSERDKCLYQLAQNKDQEKVCTLIDNPYEGYAFSRPNCITELRK